MCSGGYFAGTVFDGNKVVAHKVNTLAFVRDGVRLCVCVWTLSWAEI
jgi:hypothetical protein